MRLVYYSLLPDTHGRYESQWIESVASLRRHNPQVSVRLFVYGRVTPSLAETARAFDVVLVPAGDYSDTLTAIAPNWARLLAFCPTLHKVLSLRLLPDQPLSQLLYLDCDTFFFGDVADIFERYVELEWYAREEPCSRRSAYGYDPGYLDEDALADIARRERLEVVPPFNTGVMVLNHGLWLALASLSAELLELAGRLMLGIDRSTFQPFLSGLDSTIQSCVFDKAAALPFPSSNSWLIEAVALWLTLGRLSGVSHGVLSRHDVLQNGEFRHRKHDPVLVHYFSSLEMEFFESIRVS
ncbi:MAG: hypothetical protein ABW110_17580 [Steroidobacteraceae bacterium]